jgi:hypothetical protein
MDTPRLLIPLDGDETSIYQSAQLAADYSNADTELHLSNLSSCRTAN